MSPQERDVLERAITIIENDEHADENADWLTEARSVLDEPTQVDYNEIVAHMATQFTNGNGTYCRSAIRKMRPEEAAYVACGVYSNFISMDKEKALRWDTFLQRGV